jgi:Protein of unknown function (DUF4058)
MKSPFPGMDPYIEACGLWEDFHNHFVERIYDHVAAAVPDRYMVRTGERSYVVLVEEEGQKKHAFLPDVGVMAPGSASSRPGVTAAVAEPDVEPGAVNMRALIDTRYRETFVEIYDTDPEQRLVTCIEVLSPSNKRRGSEGWDIYLRKRQSLLLGTANLVEIDLVRGGQKMPMAEAWPSAPYSLLVCRQQRAPDCTVWPAHFRRPLPAIPVPLASPDPDLSLTLQPMIEAIYARGRYYRSIDYADSLTPPLEVDERNWLAEQLRTTGPA